MQYQYKFNAFADDVIHTLDVAASANIDKDSGLAVSSADAAAIIVVPVVQMSSTRRILRPRISSGAISLNADWGICRREFKGLRVCDLRGEGIESASITGMSVTSHIPRAMQWVWL